MTSCGGREIVMEKRGGHLTTCIYTKDRSEVGRGIVATGNGVGGSLIRSIVFG